MLHVVATPIGNLGDLSPRALDAFKGASLIACEDTRRTWQLLAHFGVPRPEMLSYRQGNEERTGESIAAALRAGREVVDMAALKARCIAFSDDGSGIQEAAVMREAMTLAAREDCLVVAHCEDLSQSDPARMEWMQIARDLELAAETRCRYHVCHISTRRSVELIREAKRRGVRVTCETAPHYLTLCEADIQDEGRFKMNPPIHSADDREALIEGLADGTVDVIATDHAPHTAEEKSRGFAHSLNGIVGLETAFPVLYTKLVEPGRISLGRLIEAMSTAPRRIFRIGGGLGVGEQADMALIDLQESFTIQSREFLSKGRSTPFEGWPVLGKCLLTVHDGKAIYISEDK